MKKEILMVLALVVLSLLVASCSKEQAQPTGGITVDTISKETVPTTTPAEPAAPVTEVVTEPETSATVVETSPAQAEDANVKEFAISAKNWEFVPNEIRVQKGDKVRITLTSADVAHGFAIAELGVKEKVEGGETRTFEFVANLKGTFIYYCWVPCGTGHIKMKGKFIVE